MTKCSVAVILTLLVTSTWGHHTRNHKPRNFHNIYYQSHQHWPQHHHWPHDDKHPNFHGHFDPHYFDYNEHHQWPEEQPWENWFPDEDLRFTTLSPDFIEPQTDSSLSQCIRSCRASPEYNPVCGTNYVEYYNIGVLECVRGCGVDVGLLRRTKCPPPPNTSTTSPASTKPTKAFEVTTEVEVDSKKLNCVKSCPFTPEYNPVCGVLGNNYLTYDNIRALKCAKACGIGVDLFRRSKCPQDLQTAPSTTEESTTPTTIPPELNFDIRFGNEKVMPYSS